MSQENDKPEAHEASATASAAAQAANTTVANDMLPPDVDVLLGGAPRRAPTPEELAARVQQLEEENGRLRTDYLRALAEAQNAQARADRRIEQNTKYAVANFVKDLVQVADNLERALQHVPPDARAGNDQLNGLATGVEMTEKALMTLLERNGLTRLDSLNQPFDPNRHQAMQEMENPAVPAGTVVQVFQEGYILHDRLIRPAMVVVSRGGPKRQPAPQATQAAQEAPAGGSGDHTVDTTA